MLNEAENKQSKSLSEIEAQKYTNEESARHLADIEQERTDLENEADRIQAEKDKNQMLFRYDDI